MKHNLAFVRMNPHDETLHCERHGLLTPEEALSVWERAFGLPDGAPVARAVHWPRFVLAIIDRWGRLRHSEECA